MGNPLSAITNPIGTIVNTVTGGGGSSNQTSGSFGNLRDNLRNGMIDSANNYWGRVNDAQNKLRDDVDNYSNDYEKKTNQYVGNQGYQNGLNQAQKGAMSSANQAGAAAQGAARSMGMSKGAAAAMGSGQTINAYNQGLANQQAMVQNNYNNALQQQGNVYSTKSNMSNQIASNLTNAAGQDVANRVNTANAAYGNQDAIEKLLTGADSSLGGGLGSMTRGFGGMLGFGGGGRK